MRIITGQARGRRLKEPAGQDTRPTTERVKEALFSIVQFSVPGQRVLDLFAGTGQLGAEALSRGAAACTFVDLSPRAAAVVRENVARCGFADRARVVQGDALAFLAACGEQFGLILLDPPYRSDLLARSLDAVARFDILAEGGIMVCESEADTPLPPVPPPCRRVRDYRYGRIRLTVCDRPARSTPEGNDGR